MRIGKNPQKGKRLDLSTYIHQVIIPVYIPHESGYFKDCKRILELCLNSLVKTVHDRTFITVVNNGSCKNVVSYLNAMYTNDEIHEIIHTNNIGKSNAILKGLRGHSFDFITISDADVMFLDDWQEETMQIFNSFPKAGVVGLIPQMKMYGYLSSNVIFDFFLSKKLRFSKVVNPPAMKLFYKSLGWGEDFNHNYLKWQLTLKANNGVKSVVGSGHVTATYKKEALLKNFDGVIDEFLGPKFLSKLLDYPVLRAGGYRLTTEDNYAFHMGNTIESWMEDVKWSGVSMSLNESIYRYVPLKGNAFSHFIKNHIFRKLLQNRLFLHWFVAFKGLPKKLVKIPWHE